MRELLLDDNWKNQQSNFCIPFSDYRDCKVLAASVAESFTVPDGAYKVFFQITPAGSTFWVDDGKTAVIPAADITNGSAPEMNPAGRKVVAGQTLSVITDISGAIIQANYYS